MPDKIVKAHCNECGPDRRHLLVEAREQRGTTQHESWGDIEWVEVFEMLECQGCGNVVLRQRVWYPPFLDEENAEVTYCPPAISRRIPAWNRQLPDDIAALMKEVYNALHADSRRLAMMGARAMLDMAILNQVGDVGTFKQKLNAMEAKGFLSDVGKEILDAALEAGNAASHRGHKATTEQVNQVIDIIENMLQTIYVLKPAAENLKKTTPERKRTKKKVKNGKKP